MAFSLSLNLPDNERGHSTFSHQRNRCIVCQNYMALYISVPFALHSVSRLLIPGFSPPFFFPFANSFFKALRANCGLDFVLMQGAGAIVLLEKKRYFVKDSQGLLVQSAKSPPSSLCLNPNLMGGGFMRYRVRANIHWCSRYLTWEHF